MLLLAPGTVLDHQNKNIRLPVFMPQSRDTVTQIRDLMIRDPRDGSATRLDDMCDISVQPIRPKMGQMQLNGHPSLAIAIRWAESTFKDETQQFLKSFTLPTRAVSFDHIDANGNDTLVTDKYSLKVLLDRYKSEQSVLLSSLKLLLISFTVLAGVLLLRMH